MKNPKVSVGSLYLIPGGGSFAIGKVIYISKYFKNVILVRLFTKAFKSPEDAVAPSVENESELIYTGTNAIKPGEWIYFGEQGLAPSEKEMTRRIVGGDVWLEDTHLGSASADDIAKLSNMRVAGYLRVTDSVAALASRGA